MTKMSAVVKYPCKEVTTKFGKRLTVVFQTDNGEQITKWGMSNDRIMPTLKRNQKVTLDKEGNKIIVIPINEGITEQMLTNEAVNEKVKDTFLQKTQVKSGSVRYQRGVTGKLQKIMPDILEPRRINHHIIGNVMNAAGGMRYESAGIYQIMKLNTEQARL